MDLSRAKKMLAGIAAAATFVSQSGIAIAAYSDVPSGVWYEDAVDAFLDADYLDASQTRFRGGENANRAEFVKLVVELNGGILSTPPSVPSFSDVAPGAWYYGYFEEAGKEGWVRGDGSCYGTKPCNARPAANINRAEAAAIINRAFALESTGDAPQFVDNPSSQWYTEDIQTAADHCVLQGDDSTGRVRPADLMNRAEMVVMLNRVDQGLMFGEDCGQGVITDPSITDVVPTSPTTLEVSFNLTLDATAAEDEAMYEVTGDDDLDVTEANLMNDDTVELTLGTATVAGDEYTLTVSDMEAADGTVFSDSMMFSGYTSIVQGDGTLEVSLSSNTPVGDTVPQGAIGIVMTSVDLTASDDDVILENLTVLHEGFGEEANISGVYGVINGERVTRKRSIDSQSTTATVRFQVPLVIQAGETVTLDLAADLNTGLTASSEHSLTVELPSDLESNAKEVTGNFPLRGNTFRVAAVTTGVVSVSYRSVTPTKIQVGDSKATLGRFEFAVNSTEDQTVYSVTLENDGTTSDGDVTNLQVRRTDGTVLTNTVAQTVGDFATFVFDPPFTILEGDNVSLELVGDVVGGAAKNVKFHFDEASDLFAVGSLYGYGVNGQLYGSQITLPTETASLPTTVTIDAGQLTISIDGPTSADFTPDDDDAVLANVQLETGGEDVEIEELYIAIQGTTSTGAAFVVGRGSVPTAADEIDEVLEDVELRNTVSGRTVTGIPLTTSGTSSTKATTGNGTGAFQIYRFDDFVVRGDENYELRVDFIDNSGDGANAAPKNGDRFRVHICGESQYELSTSNDLTANTTGCSFGGLITSSTAYQLKVKGASTNDSVGDVRPGGTISGNFHDIKTAGLTITHRRTLLTDTTVKNAKDVNLMRFEARAGEAEDILVTDLIFEATATSQLVNASNYSLWVDTNGDSAVDKVLQSGESSQSNKISFDDITGGGWVIPADSTVVFEVHGDIAASISSVTTLQLRFATGSTFVQAEQVDDGSALSGIQYSVQGTSTATAVDSSVCTASLTASTCEVIVTTNLSTTYSIRNAGDLYVTRSTTPVRDRQLLGGKTEAEILRLQLHAEYEDIDVTDLVLSATGANASTLSQNVDRLEIYKAGATTPFATATNGECSSTAPANSMCVNMENQQLIVAKGADLDILVKPVMRTDQQGATRGQVVAIYVNSGAVKETIQARGRLSSNDLAETDADGAAEGEIFINTTGLSTANSNVQGSTNQVVLSKAVVANINPAADGTAISAGDDQAIGQFKFSAASHDNTLNGLNDWVLSGVIFNVNATNVLLGTGDQAATATSDFKFYNKADSSVKATCLATPTSTSEDAQSGSLVVKCIQLRGTNVQTSIDAGTDATFVLEMDVVNPKILSTSTSTLQVSLTSFTTRTTSTFGAAVSHLEWVDDDQGTDVTFAWIEQPETTINSTSYRN